MWASLPEETMDKLSGLSNLRPSGGVLGVCVCAGMHGFDYWIVFEITGAMSNAVQDGCRYIFNEWFSIVGLSTCQCTVN
ncbi:MAG: hypothetical protein LBH04_10455 [Tannerellaceae bacterium]|nr:hypothetical protein [Tannerellaceae bacterium]